MRKFSTLLAIIALLSMIVMGVSAQESDTITFDEPVTGELDSQTYEQFYTFEGTAGDTIVVRMTATDDVRGLDSYLFLKDADGNILASDDDSAGNLNSLLGPYTIEEDGIYTIVATRFQQENGNSEGSYELTLSIYEVETIAVGDNPEFVLSAENSPQIFEFVVEESGLYRLNYYMVDGIGGSDLSVLDADDNYITGVNVDESIGFNFTTMSLEAGDMLNLFARYYPYGAEDADNPQATVSMSLEAVEAEALELEIDETTDISGVLETVESVAYYTFDAGTGQTFQVEGNAPDGGEFEVYTLTPSGYPAFYGGTGYQYEGNTVVAPQIVTQEGEYILVIHRTDIYDTASVDDDEPVAYELGVLLSTTPELVPGEAIEAELNTTDQIYEDAYVYNGTEGETITITLEGLNDTYATSFSISLDVQDDYESSFYANFNSSAGGTVSYEVTLPRDGTYIVRVYDGGYNYESNGEYRLLLGSDASDE